MCEDSGITESDCFAKAAVGESPLPDELLAEIIFQYIPLCQWSSTFEFVTKQFRRCVRIAYSRVKSINFRKLFSLNQPTENYEAQSNYFSCRSPEKLNNILTKLLSVCPKLTDMTGFKDVTPSLNVDAWNILKKFHRLESISFESVRFQFQDFLNFVANCQSLKNLSIMNCSIDGVRDVYATLDINSLTGVALCNNALNTAAEFRMENFGEKLTSLTLDGFQRRFGCNRGDTENLMINCINLEAFSIRLYSDDDYKIFFKSLPNFCKLTHLRVTGHLYRGQVDVFCAKFCDWLDSMKNQLQSIEMNDLALNKNVYNSFTKCERLHSLILAGSAKRCIFARCFKNLPLPPLPDALIKFSISSGTDRFILQYPKPIKLPVLLPMLLQLPNLTDLELHENCRFSGIHLEAICELACLQNLRLYARDRHNINDSLLETWDRKNPQMFETLISLELPRCAEISDIGACLLAKKGLNLEILDLELAKIGDSTILILADVAKKVRKANFIQNGESRIGEKAILYLIEKAVYLKQLKINKSLASKIHRNKEFLPFFEDVEIAH